VNGAGAWTQGDFTPLAWTGRDILAATGGERACGDPARRFTAIGIDSRTLSAGQVFVAIRGETHDGHRYAPDVVAAGGRGLILARDALSAPRLDDWQAAGVFCVAVDDTLRALGDLARFHRRRNPARVVAITGSNGKTTTRAMTAAVLARRHAVIATRGNFNNAVGLPLSLFALAPAHDWAVFEIGTNHPGEIDRLAEICQPDLGVITNIGPAHLEGLGSLEGVREAKGELLARLAPGGRAALNADDPQVMLLAGRCGPPPLLFGLSEAAAVRAEDLRCDGGGLVFRLRLPGGDEAPVRLAVGAAFMATNALAAAAAGWHAGLSAADIAAGLAAFTPVAGRMTRLVTGRGVVIIDDSYNANPASVAAALGALALQRQGGRTVAVLGEMRELGNRAAALHRQVGMETAAAGIDRLCTTGPLADEVAAGAREKGMPGACIQVGAKDEIVAELSAWLAPGDTVLVKGSRAAAMETLVAALQRRLQEG
jgi:UDP-N-acetylmuramoyl-tripeptide--D-alanyl-D-alanine ligase